MVQIGRRRGATGMTVPLMIGAFVVIAGFLYWLSASAEPTAPPILEEEEEVQMSEVEALVVDPAEIGGGAAGYVSLTVQIDDVEVTQHVGGSAFFVQLPQAPFLVHASPEVAAAGLPAVGARVSVVGEVVEMTRGVISGWAQAEEFTEEERPLIEFATHYIEAVEVLGGDGAPGGSDADTAGSGD